MLHLAVKPRPREGGGRPDSCSLANSRGRGDDGVRWRTGGTFAHPHVTRSARKAVPRPDLAGRTRRPNGSCAASPCAALRRSDRQPTQAVRKASSTGDDEKCGSARGVRPPPVSPSLSALQHGRDGCTEADEGCEAAQRIGDLRQVLPTVDEKVARQDAGDAECGCKGGCVCP